MTCWTRVSQLPRILPVTVEFDRHIVISLEVSEPPYTAHPTAKQVEDKARTNNVLSSSHQALSDLCATQFSKAMKLRKGRLLPGGRVRGSFLEEEKCDLDFEGWVGY